MIDGSTEEESPEGQAALSLSRIVKYHNFSAYRHVGTGDTEKMSTLLANPAEMIAQGAPHVIHNDLELAAYTEALFQLTAMENPSRTEVEAIELLTLLIERYERERCPIPEADPVSVIRFLLEHNNLAQ